VEQGDVRGGACSRAGKKKNPVQGAERGFHCGKREKRFVEKKTARGQRGGRCYRDRGEERWMVIQEKRVRLSAPMLRRRKRETALEPEGE